MGNKGELCVRACYGHMVQLELASLESLSV